MIPYLLVFCIIFALIFIFSSLAIAENACHNNNVSRIAVANGSTIDYSMFDKTGLIQLFCNERRSNEAKWIREIDYLPGGVRKNE